MDHQSSGVAQKDFAFAAVGISKAGFYHQKEASHLGDPFNSSAPNGLFHKKECWAPRSHKSMLETTAPRCSAIINAHSQLWGGSCCEFNILYTFSNTKPWQTVWHSDPSCSIWIRLMRPASNMRTRPSLINDGWVD